MKDPAYLNSFILAYSKVIMNRCIDGFDGVTDWDKPFYCTDTDYMFIHINQIKDLQQNMPEIIGKGMGQLRDDIYEVTEGKSIIVIFLASMLYILQIIGYSKKKGEEGKLVVVYHIRSKCVLKRKPEKLTIEKFQDMLDNSTKIGIETRIFANHSRKQNLHQFKLLPQSKNK